MSAHCQLISYFYDLTDIHSIAIADSGRLARVRTQFVIGELKMTNKMMMSENLNSKEESR